MNTLEAKELMKNAPRDEKPSRVNASLTRSQVAGIVDNYLETLRDDKILDHLMEKRVLQASRDRKRVLI
jgi:hypothetical protein